MPLILYSKHLQVLLEPVDGLAESLLLGPLEVGDAQISADSEAVGDTAVQVDLPGLASLDEGLLRLVTELGGEDVVDFYSNQVSMRGLARISRKDSTYGQQQWTEGPGWHQAPRG